MTTSSTNLIEIHQHYLWCTCLTGSVKLTASMVSSTLRTLPKKSVIRTLPGLLRKRSVRWPGVDTHWLLGHTLNCEHTKQPKTMTCIFSSTDEILNEKNPQIYSIYQIYTIASHVFNEKEESHEKEVNNVSLNVCNFIDNMHH